MSPVVKVLHTAKTGTTGGREFGVSRSSDGLLDIRLSTPGSARIGANPEQLLAAAWSASLESAIALTARQRAIVFPVGLTIDPKSIYAWLMALTSSKPASTSGCRVWSWNSPRPWWMKHIRRARTPKQRAAISTLQST